MPDHHMAADQLREDRREFNLPTEVKARPFGAPKPVRDLEEQIIGVSRLQEQDPGPIDPDLLEVELNDKLKQIAMLLRSLTCEQMWTLTEGLHKPGMEKDFITWAKRYMGEEVEEAPATKLRRA